MSDMENRDELEKLAARVKEWVNSAEGAAKLLETQKSVLSSNDAADKAGQIDPDLLRKPVTI